ncbi:MAG: Holliday junction resolvase RecU [Lachnospiraceae bacterium]|nr:Holliday junction resolvase RecU [Lachnospiraceae bacterium]
MPTWNSRGLRGSVLEDLINRTNEKYAESGLCLVQKIPTPITPIRIDQQSRHITLAYFEKKSTVDYIGAAQGVPICFDAKENEVDTFPLHNIHDHQVSFMKDFQKQGGIAFLIIYYTHRDLYYYMNIDELSVFLKRAEEGGRKSIAFSELKKDNFLPKKNGIFVPYLDMIAKDLSNC